MKKFLLFIMIAGLAGNISQTLGKEGFEAPAYQTGQSVEGKGGWHSANDVVISDEHAFEGEQALKVTAGQSVTRTSGGGVRFIQVEVLPTFEVEPTHPGLNLGGLRLGFWRTPEDKGEILIYSGTNEAFAVEKTSYVIDEDGLSTNWIQVTARVDGSKADLFLDGQPIEANLAASGSDVQIDGPTAGVLFVDSWSEGEENPLFADADHDGMPDAEETAFGLNPFGDDRLGDIDSDGINNIQEFFSGNSPSVVSNPGTSGNGPRTLFVDNIIGSDSNSGLKSYRVAQAGPLASIGAAIIAAQDGDTIDILPGTGVYNAPPSPVPSKPIRIQANNVRIQQ